ncbi:MAG: hypothetical protein WCX65_00825 [bacterium]
MAKAEPMEKCSCGGKLADYDDYLAKQAVKRGVAALPAAVILCAVWAPLFCLVRLGIGGVIGAAGASAILVLLLKKVFIGIILGVLVSVAVGIGRSDLGLFLGAVIGSLGGFFVAAASAMPLKSDATHRLDVVLVAVISGILCAATVYFAEAYGRSKYAKYIGPEPHEGTGAGGN